MKLQPNDFFTSDTHWQHKNVLQHCARPFHDDARHLWGFPNYEPWSLVELEWVMAQRDFIKVDHHAPR